MPFIVALAMTALVCDEDRPRRKAIQCWSVGVVLAYFASVIYGLHWSPYYSRDQYLTSLRPLFGPHWKTIVESIIVLGMGTWAGCWAWTRQRQRRDHLTSWLVRPIDRWLGLTVAIAVVICLVKIYWLGWTSHYELLGARFHLSGKEWWSASASSLWALFIFLGPFMMFGFFMIIGRRQIDPRVGLLRLFVIEFFIYAVVVQWITFYSPYYARYLLSEVVPYLILIVVCVWHVMGRGKARRFLSAALALSLVYSAAVSAMQIGKNEDQGAYPELARLTAPVDPGDVILLDTLSRRPNTNLIKTPLVYTFHRNVVTVGDKAVSDNGYLAKLRSIYPDVFLISSDPAAPDGFERIDTVLFRPMTYQHSHSFPRRLVPQADVLLYLYRLDTTRVSLGEELRFGTGDPWGAWLQSGWSVPEAWGVWSNSDHAELSVKLPRLALGSESVKASDGRFVLRLSANIFVNAAHPTQRITVSVDGKTLGKYTVRYPAAQWSIDIPLKRSAFGSPSKMRIGFSLPDAASPKSLGLGGDARELALGLTSAEFLQIGAEKTPPKSSE